MASHNDNPLVLPDTVSALIDLLDHRAFPLRAFPADVTMADVHRHGGARDVVEFLRSLQRESEAFALGGGIFDRED
jgi:hypothetical protein